jgi:hypothetical protein
MWSNGTMAHGKGRLAVALCAVAVAAALGSPPAHATFDQFEAWGTFDCEPNDPNIFGDNGQNSALVEETETIGIGTATYPPFGPLLGAAARIEIQPDPTPASCSVTASATSRLTWRTTDALGLPPATTSSFELRIYFDGSIQQADAPPGSTASALMSVGASLLDSNGSVIDPLGSMDCGVLGCSSAEFTLQEDSTDASGPGFRGRTFGISTGTIIFDAIRVGTFTIRLDLLSEALASGFCCSSSALILSDFGGTLLYEIVSLDPDVSVAPEPIPEPAAVGLIGLGLGVLAYLRRRRS